jgi:hypothetical protein
VTLSAADFLRWARRRRINRHDLTLPSRVTQDPTIVISDTDRWDLLSRCLHDTDLPLDVRAAGALLLQYGIQLSRIVELTTDHLTPDGLRIDLAAPAINTPPALRRLLDQLPGPPCASASPLITPAAATRSPWLFPGRSTKGHVAASTLSSHLRGGGISVRASRNAALIALAADVPAAVVSDLFRISIANALQWTRRAGRDWHSFIAATAQPRSAEPSSQCGTMGAARDALAGNTAQSS